ncbi:MAG: glycosyl hydrolase [Acidobacteriaceae bacterium]
MPCYGLKLIGCLLLVGLSCLGMEAQSDPTVPVQDAMKRGFINPPSSSRPRVWWHWMNGNITQEGITLDLEWMHRVGVAGFTVFEGAINTPQVVPHRLVYMTPAWKEAFNQAVSTARKLGLEVSIASSPGWSETGGPWVPPSHGMKKMVWSATRVEGGRRYLGDLPLPSNETGTFQNYRTQSRVYANGNISPALPHYYADSAVVAYRIPEGDKTQSELKPQVTSSGGFANVAALSDGDVNTVALDLPVGAPGRDAWVEFDYGRPQTIQAVTLATLDDIVRVFAFDDQAVNPPRLEVSDDGQHFRKIADIPPSSIPQRTVAFDAVTARFFKLSFTPSPSINKSKAVTDHLITELVLNSGARVNEFEKRAGYATVRDYYAIPDPRVVPEFIVAKQDVVDLTSKMKPNGYLDWTPPAGKWTILRIGYSLTGHENGPAPQEATGLEVDKLTRQYVRNYLDSYLKMYSNTVGTSRIGKSGISFMLTDSAEVGAQNWSKDILSEFKERRGYDPHLWLPALTGVVIQSPESTDRFLWDFRRTISELIALNHYGEIAQELHSRGMGYYGEALEYHRPSLGDDMEIRSRTDIPMGAMWTFSESAGPTPSYVADLQGAASVAHIYGQNIVGAESLTTGPPAWVWAPDNLKRIADLEFSLGVNRFMIHESTHQPLVNKVPGLTLGINGQWFNRNETWADEAGPWLKYLARCSYLLQQGRFYGDVAYFYGEEGPLTAVFGLKPQQDAPQGYGFDFMNSDVILHRLSMKAGRLVTPSGASYRILYLGGTSSRMTLPVLRRLRELVSQGAVIAGSKPVDSPSLSDNQAEFHAIADDLWGSGTQPSVTVRRFGKGSVYSGKTANEVLADLHLDRDFEYTQPEADTKLMFVHRSMPNYDIYFVDNRKDRSETFEAFFRVEGKIPELWDAATGISKPVSYQSSGGRTGITLHLDPYGTVFVVFRKKTDVRSLQLPQPAETYLRNIDLNADWTVSFQADRGAPKSFAFDHLISWSASMIPGIKYFSGTATYERVLFMPIACFRPGAHLWLDLGDVKDLADVAINGQDVGILWKYPYKIELTNAIKPGKNLLTISVTNLWVNRLIGDQQSNIAKKYTFTDIRPYTANSALLPSGLLGPIRVSSISPQSIVDPGK